ncbi:MAG TPA: hypothetical protein VF337_10680 [Candidatus Limnocylindrales bacterium]
MDYRGQMCSLYRVAWQQTAIRPTQFDPSLAADSFERALAATLSGAGLDLRMPLPGMADPNLVVRPEIVRADPGSRSLRWMFTMLAGHAIFEVRGLVGGPAGPFGAFQGKGTRRWGIYGGDSRVLLNDAARMAGERAAAQILALLAAQ